MGWSIFAKDMSSMFYTKIVEIYQLESVTDDWGAIVEEQYTLVKRCRVDIQPNSKDKLNREYGYDLETTKRMFVDIDPQITEASLIVYDGKPYHVVKIIEWDDYYDIALNDAVGVSWHG